MEKYKLGKAKEFIYKSDAEMEKSLEEVIKNEFSTRKKLKN